MLSLGARSFMLGEPCQSPCNRAGEHTLIFDEAYYVNAARVIAGLRPPPGAHYADAPSGVDPNAEHPQLAKLIMAGAIELFGDGPFAWRIGSLIFGTLAILGMYCLVRCAGGGRWTALGAATLMACDNLMLIHGRIGTLDIYTVAMMIWGMAIYLRGHPVLAGITLGVAAAFKLVAPYLWLSHRPAGGDPRRCPPGGAAGSRPPGDGGRALLRLVVTTVVGFAAFIGLLAIMDQIATPYADADAKLITGGPFAHLAHMISYAAQQTSPHGPMGIASYPWQWLLDLNADHLPADQPVAARRRAVRDPSGVEVPGRDQPPDHRLALPALVFCAYRFVRCPGVRRARGDDVGAAGAGVAAAGTGMAPAGTAGPRGARVAPDEVQLAILAVAWFLGTWFPFEALSVLDTAPATSTTW